MQKVTNQNQKQIKVSDVMLHPKDFPVVNDNEMVRETLEKMNIFKLGICCITDSKNKLIGIITDGDFRRILLSEQKPLGALFVDDILDHSSRNFISISPEETIIDAVELMGECKIWDLPVVNSQNILLGLLHLHPAIKKMIEKI